MLFDSPEPFSALSADPATDQPAATAWAGDVRVVPGEDLWVFGYGSLMWNPGFHYLEARPAVLGGYHRRFCVASMRYRGTPDQPGLVLGLDRGGSCRGVAFRVAADGAAAALDYLWDREMSTRAYRARCLPLRLGGDGIRRVTAVSFVVDRRHRQYCGCLGEAEMVERIAGCCGERGRNADYLANTVEHLKALGIRDRRLFQLHDEVRRRLG